MATTISAEARQLHDDAYVIDMHVDSFLLTRQFGYDFLKRHRPMPFGALFRHADLPRMSEGGVDACGFGVVTNPRQAPLAAWQNCLYQMDLFKATCRRSDGALRPITSAADARAAKAARQRAGFSGIEGAHCLGDDLNNVRHVFDEGARYIGLAHFSTNKAVACAKGIGADQSLGISDWGRELIAHMNDIGMMVDLAHVGRQSFLDAVAASETPCIISHTGFRGVRPMWRNIDDDMLRALAAKGGVACVIFTPQYLSRRLNDSAQCIFEHIEYAVNKVGEDHVGIGSDADGYIFSMPANLRDMSRYPILTEIMLRKGYSETRIRKILGENVLRVWEACETAGRKPAGGQAAAG